MPARGDRVDGDTLAGGAEGEEPDLVRRARAGDRRGLEALVDRHGEALMQYLMSILRSREAAEDAFQDTWVKVLRRAARLDPGRPFAPWLFRVARNRAYDHLRGRRRWSLFGFGAGQDPAAMEGVAAPEAASERLAAEDEAARLLEGLEPAHREVIWLRFYRDCSYDEIAAICGVRLGTVKSRLRRALDRLAALHARIEAGAGGAGTPLEVGDARTGR